MVSTRPQRDGFTLAELLIALALMAMILTAAAMGLFAASVSHDYNNEKNEMVARTRGVLDRAARDVRRAETFSIPDHRTLRAKMSDGETRTYAWNGTTNGPLTLTVSDGAGDQVATLTGSVKSFVVSAADPGVRIDLRLEGDVASTETSITVTPRHLLFDGPAQAE